MSFFARSSLVAARPMLARRSLVTRNVLPAIASIQLRGVASSNSVRPGSQSLSHAALNVKEEVGNTARDLAHTLGGGALASGSITDSSDGFLGVTAKVAATVPQPAMVVGLAGSLPYLGTSLTTLYLAREAGTAAHGVLGVNADPEALMAALNQCLTIQSTYGAILLGFLGAVHFGFEFSGYGGHKGYQRLLLGSAPILYAWPTLMLEPTTAIVAQWAGFTALWAADQKATLNGWTPAWYSQYRFYLSLLIGTCMIGTLAGVSYYGPTAGHGFTTHEIERLRDERHHLQPSDHGTVNGPIQALPAAEDGDSFVIIRKQEPKQEKNEKAKE